MRPASRSAVYELVEGWESGRYTDEQVRAGAELLLEAGPEGVPAGDEDLLEVLLQMDGMQHQLLTRDDIPALKRLLDESTDMDERLARWRSYFDAVDLRKRAASLRDQDFYSPGVQGVLGGR
jgi:hypothetical protein